MLHTGNISIGKKDTPVGFTWRNCCQAEKVPGCNKVHFNYGFRFNMTHFSHITIDVACM